MKVRVLVCVMAVQAAVAGGAAAQAPPPARAALAVVPLRPNVSLITGAGANIVVQFGPDGVVVVDSGAARTASAVLALIKSLSDQPIRYIINTSASADHVSGNEAIAKAGRAFGRDAGVVPANIIAAEPALNRMMSPQPGGGEAYPVGAWPTETFTRKQKTLFLNGEGIQVMYQPAAHSDGDSIVFFRRSDVVATGEIFDIDRFPVIAVDRGGSIQGEIDAMNRLLDVAIPSVPLPYKPGGTLVVPARGRVCEQAELVEYRDMLTIIRDTVQKLVSKGLTLEQVKAANPTQGYRRRYGADAGPWTTDMFVEAVYRGLAGKS